MKTPLPKIAVMWLLSLPVGSCDSCCLYDETYKRKMSEKYGPEVSTLEGIVLEERSTPREIGNSGIAVGPLVILNENGSTYQFSIATKYGKKVIKIESSNKEELDTLIQTGIKVQIDLKDESRSRCQRSFYEGEMQTEGTFTVYGNTIKILND